MVEYVTKFLFGSRSDRLLRSLQPILVRTNDLEKRYTGLSDLDLRACTASFRERIARGESLESIEPEAYAVVREAARRALGMRHFDVQVLGGAVLHRGAIAEMKTGEGKTLVATLPAYLNALEGKGVHVVTVNDYLARRDAEWMGRIYSFLDLTVGTVVHSRRDAEKREAYGADITYGHNSEFGFDYLRDNMAFSLDRMYQRGHNFAIVDEVDSILVDEARVPLIISGPSEESTELYYKINQIIPHLKRDEHFQVEVKTKQPSLTEAGIARVEELLGIPNLYDPAHIHSLRHVDSALRAHHALQRDVDYVVQNGQVMIVDEFTGRILPGRRWSDGLHQAVEAKEGLRVASENQTLASVTFQNFFRLYKKISGMTGTAETEAAEFKKIYNLEVVVVPTNRKMVRADVTDSVFRTKKEKYDSIIKEISEAYAKGQPVLVGTVTIEQSELVSRLLKDAKVPHNVLNAKHHEREAEIVAQAGRYQSVTIATNMAGRGTDIVLGGNPEFLAHAEAKTRDRSSPIFTAALEKFKAQCAEEREKVVGAGGLFVLGTERHESRRIDNQLRGRSGRQGDPGRSKFMVSLEDDLMLRFGADRIQFLMQKFGWEDGASLEGGLISRSIETAQKRVEGYHFEIRKHLLELDDVMNKQRQVVYNLRARVLKAQALREELYSMIDDFLEDIVVTVCDDRVKPVNWDLNVVKERFQFLTNSPLDLASDLRLDAQTLFDHVRTEARRIYDERAATQSGKLEELAQLMSAEVAMWKESFSDVIPVIQGQPLDFRSVEQEVFLETLDLIWREHLQEMDHLKEGIDLRAWGMQKNRLHEYQKEGFFIFQKMLGRLREEVLRKLYYYHSPDPKSFVAHIEAERKRREELAKQMQTVYTSPLGEGEEAAEGAAGGKPGDGRSADAQRAKLEAQRKERRKLKR